MYRISKNHSWPWHCQSAKFNFVCGHLVNGYPFFFVWSIEISTANEKSVRVPSDASYTKQKQCHLVPAMIFQNWQFSSFLWEWTMGRGTWFCCLAKWSPLQWNWSTIKFNLKTKRNWGTDGILYFASGSFLLFKLVVTICVLLNWILYYANSKRKAAAAEASNTSVALH